MRAVPDTLTHDGGNTPNASPAPRAFWRWPGVAGVAIAAVSIPLVVLWPSYALLTATLALCLYPLLDVPRILARPSWWRAAAVSVFVWCVVFVTMMGVVEAVRHPREDAMIFLVPFSMYPLVLGISGLVRVGGHLWPRARPSEARLTLILGAIACGLLVGIPVSLSVLPVLIAKVTGNSPPNSISPEEGDVVSASAGEFSVRLASGATKSFRLSPETKFDFRGPGSAIVKGPPAGPSWLKPGQRVALEYVTRGYVDRAERVNIWLERAGCRGDAKWVAASHASLPSSVPSLEGTTWEGSGPTFEFLAGNRLTYQYTGGPRNTTGAWKQDGPAILIEVNDCYAEYEGRIEGDAITGEYSNEVGGREGWTAHRSSRPPVTSGGSP
ncbi:MAG TPA: hypothetical protein VFK70_00790 [Vicinamibacteria bacterium]|nr:hypothetical protein [Vicinamibacteria bacterium]